MDELNEEIERLSRIDYYPPGKRIALALKMISALRARLESARSALRAQEDLIEHLRHCPECGEGPPCDACETMVREADELRRVALGAAGEKENRSNG